MLKHSLEIWVYAISKITDNVLSSEWIALLTPRTGECCHVKGAMSPHTHARANENKLEKVGPSFSSSVGDFGRLFLSV